VHGVLRLEKLMRCFRSK